MGGGYGKGRGREEGGGGEFLKRNSSILHWKEGYINASIWFIDLFFGKFWELWDEECEMCVWGEWEREKGGKGRERGEGGVV